MRLRLQTETADWSSQLIPLPIDPFIDSIRDVLLRSRAAVITAAPGAGKTTRVAPALAGDGPVILLQPRRVAARAIASRIADERGWTIGREVGWQTRFDRRLSRETPLLVVTEGILTARLQTDPLLSDFATVILDEFHERSIHADLALALARQAWLARGDLRLIVMSATLETSRVSAFLNECPSIDIPGRMYPVEVSYASGQPLAEAVAEAMRTSDGHVLCFLPGAPEIGRAIADLHQKLAGADVDIVPLHGSLDASAQDLALRPPTRRRIVIATNIAETSLTVPGVTAVVDTGLHKVARYDVERGIDTLETERITADAAEQRAGRAGRVAPGIVRRLWDARDRLRPHREPEIHRIDLAGPILDVIAWGGNPRTLEWFERPRDDALDAAIALLGRLGLITHPLPHQAHQTYSPHLTSLGDQARRLPLHPRLSRMLVEACGTPEVVRACALLSERHLLPPRTASTSSDLLSAIDRWNNLPSHVHQVARQIADSARAISNQSAISNQQSAMSEASFRRAVFAGYPDRVAQRREAGSPYVRLASGAGAVVGSESGVQSGEFVVAVDVRGQPAGGRDAGRSAAAPNVAVIRIASIVDREWLEPTSIEVVHRFDADAGKVKAVRVEHYDALVLSERPTEVDPEVAAQMVVDAWLQRPPQVDDERLLRRLRFAGRDVDVSTLVRAAARGARSLDDVRLERALTPDALRDLERDAPDTITVPSGRRVRVEYNEDGTVTASVKLQELFGLAETPRIGRRSDPVLLALLAPNGRPVQITRDLRSFWDRTYPEVRKELRGRYPKHPWPEDPWAAPPTARTKRR